MTFGLIENIGIDLKMGNGQQRACRADRVAQLDESFDAHGPARKTRLARRSNSKQRA
ncbi:MAG TPA: hypothetical protein VEK37_15115 [Gemmatimonadaceae bacterium]|nr:hypothetical protein [Gemmatimonadaceae bacterium]